MVTSKEVLLKAQEIKRRLLSKGEHAEEEVICELLESLDSNFKGNQIEHIVNMITDNQDFNSQTYENQAGPSHTEVTIMSSALSSSTDSKTCDDTNHESSNVETTCMTSNAPSSSMDSKTCDDTNYLSSHMETTCSTSNVPSSSMDSKTCDDMNDLSDSDDDRDFYYSYNSDSVEIIDEVLSSSLSPISPISASSPLISIYAPSLDINSQDKATNNNKAAIVNNNNLSEIVMEENNNDVVCLDHDKIKREAESPKPGCSKDSTDDTSLKVDEFCNTCNSEDLQKDAKQIHSILSGYDYSLIYETLLKNQNAMNRIELTLWDLLPEERPTTRILCKAKFPDKLVFDNNKTKVEADTLLALDAEMATRNQDTSNHVHSEAKLERLNTSKRLLQEQGPDSTKTIQKKVKYINSASDASVSLKSSNILRPAKLTFDNTFPVPWSAPLEKQQQQQSFYSNIHHGPHQAASSSSLESLPTAKYRRESLSPAEPMVSFPERKSKHVLSPPKLHLPKQPENVTSTSASTSKAVMNNDEQNPLYFKYQKLIPPRNYSDFVNQQLAAAAASNKTLSKTETKEAKFMENACLPRKKSLEEIASSLAKKCTNVSSSAKVAAKLSLVLSDRTKDMPTLNAFHSYNNNNIKVSREEGNVDVPQASSTKDQRVAHHEPAKQEKIENVATTSNAVLTKRACKIYYKLIPMFPTVHTEYIKQLCQKYVRDDLPDDTSILQQLADYLLDRGKEHPNVKKVEPVSVANTYDLNEQYADLLGIFPDADPGYLREKAEQLYKDPEKIKEFVQTQLENPDYPTRQQSQAKKKITDQVKQYTTDFQVERFLEIFPDPFSHFEDEKRQCTFNPHGADFLKNHFSKIRVNTMLNIYTQNKHNLSLTAKALEHLNPDMKTKRYSTSRHVLTQDIPLLQECAFIQHKEALRAYLAQLKENEEKEFNELKEKNGLLECQCCFDNECMPSKCSTCEEGHIFCNACIIRSTDVILADGKTHVTCLTNCSSEFPLAVLQRVLQPTKFSILLCKRQEAEVMAAGLEGLVSCPFCHFASIPPPEDKVFKCLNPDCMKESCRLCKELSHIPLKCEEVKTTDAARLYLEEKMTEALIRKCWKCGRTFFKEDGCNKMSCVCGAQMCYICDKPVTDYKHFQGQGGEGGSLCPLWSDDRRLNAESVIRVCNETLKHIKEKNPQVDINVAALLPKLPPKRKGPHEEIARADILPEHANRIVRQIP